MGNQPSTHEYDKSSERKPTRDNYVGCLLGVCIGDALGFMVEGDSPANCKKFVDSEIRPCIADPSTIKTHLHDRSYGKGINIGQYSDDSQLSRELLLSFTNTSPIFSPEDYANRIADLFKQSKIMGCGKATAKAVAKLNRGITWDKAGSKEGETGNGSAMRSGPVGLIFWENKKLLLECCEQQSLITHQDKRCVAGSVAIAASVVWGITHSAFHAENFVQFVAEYVLCIDKSFSEFVLQLNKWHLLSPEKAAKIIGKLGTDYDDGSIGISGFVTSSVVWSMYCFMKSPNDFMEAVCIAIQAGGDTDSTAAMLGAISGAFLGEAKLPKEFVEMVNDRGEWTCKELKELASKCYELKNKE